MSDVLDVLRASGRYSQAKRNHHPDHPAVVSAHRELITARLMAHLGEIITGAPTLTTEQVERVSALLRESGDR
ncbi:hypothetical protein [Mycolicibacterium pallens]|uniref:Uncharacterized protein n=1 Tax=Mycolicibacterium pallens TaxID=370524 RepID=A0ABX8VS23_9MYCO|nr:hypothetical protein [Mycolicibacterium pallens]QYL18665.1 hypothetical protein K0O64_09320 [Mycolicibacterium pallens]